MPRSLGLLSRIFLGVNGLLTVWCLGCCGFEPLLDSGAGAMAAPCAEATSMDAPGGASLPGVPIASSVSTGDADCACQSCCAISSVQFAFTTIASEPPAQPVSLAVTLVSVAPEPRYPPPKAPHWA